MSASAATATPYIYSSAEGEGVDRVCDVERLQGEGHEVVDMHVGVLEAAAWSEVNVPRYTRDLSTTNASSPHVNHSHNVP